ncbi:MAG: TonB-dependent receptor [Pseudomonadales bacterium]
MTKLSCFRKSVLAFAVAGAAPFSAAQMLEEVVVTAQKRAENLQDVPIAVTAITSNELADANIEGQLQLQKLTPNLNFTLVSTFAAPYLRGVGTQYALPGLESSVSVYIDDVYMPRAISGIYSFSDIERVEVLKGPQGTLYGRNATGGALRIITRDPIEDFEANAALTVGTDDRVAIDGMVNVPLGDSAALRVAARTDESDGYAKNIAPNAPFDRFNRDEEMWSAKLLLEPSDALSVMLSGKYVSKEDREGNAFFNLFPGPTEQVGAVLGGCVSTDLTGKEGCSDLAFLNNDVEMWGGALRVDYEFDTLTVSSITSYQDLTESNCADNDATGAFFQSTCAKPYTEQLTQEFLLNSQLGSRFEYTAGLYYLAEESGYPINVYGAAIDGGFGGFGLLPAAFIGAGDVEVESLAPYVQLDLDLNDSWSLTLGARYTWEEKKLIQNYGGVGQLGDDGFFIPDTVIRAPLGPCLASGQVLCEAPADNLNFSEFTPKATLSYRPSDELLVYGTIARGFKSGGYNLPAFGAVDAVDPEILNDFELGWKYQQDNVRFNGAVFYYDYQDLQVQFINPAGGGASVDNAADARLYGVELDFTWLVSDQFELAAGFGYTNSEYKDFTGDSFVSAATSPACAAAAATPDPADDAACLGLLQVPADHSGNSMTNAPETSGYLRGTYSFSMGDKGSLQASSVVNYQSEFYYDADNQFEEDARTLVSVNITWSSPNERYFASVYGENLTDVDYNIGTAPVITGGFRVPGPPRQIFLRVGVNF